MKIFEVVNTIDETFDGQQDTYTTHILKSLGVTDPYKTKDFNKLLSILGSVSVALKSLLSKNNGVDCDNLTCFSDVVSLLYDILASFDQHTISHPVKFLEGLEDSYCLTNYRDTLTEIKQTYTPEYLDLYDEMHLNDRFDLKLWAYVSFSNGDVRRHLGAVGTSKESLNEKGIAYIADTNRLQRICKSKYSNMLYPVLIKQGGCMDRDEFRSPQASLKFSDEIQMPIIFV